MKKIIFSWKNKTKTQKILLLVTLLFGILDGFLYLTGTTRPWWQTILYSVGTGVIAFVIKYPLLKIATGDKEESLRGALPAYGPIYSIWFYFKKPRAS